MRTLPISTAADPGKAKGIERHSPRCRALLARVNGSIDVRTLAATGVGTPCTESAAGEFSPSNAGANFPDHLPNALQQVDDIERLRTAPDESPRRAPPPLAGEVIAADFTLRQLAHIELILDIGGRTEAMIDHATGFDNKGCKVSADPEPFASEVSTLLARIRQHAWDTAEDPPRPALPLDQRTVKTTAIWSGPTMRDREKAQRAAAARIAEAQAEWEAAATEAGWEAWNALHF